MYCPRDNTLLNVEHKDGIEVDHCATCNGRWLDPHELDLLEATVPSTEAERRATIQYAKRNSELNCPVCGLPMIAFNYRAYNLEIDTCKDEHGFWLDGGEDGKVKTSSKSASEASNAPPPQRPPGEASSTASARTCAAAAEQDSPSSLREQRPQPRRSNFGNTGQEALSGLS
jgi:Zn-finger nucleic acid-binding protein